MNRITHQSPRQRGYGSTSSPRNDSLKHTRKHKKGRNRTKKRSTQALADRPARRGGSSALATRTDRPAATDRPHQHCGLSGPTPRTVRKRHQNHQRHTANNGPSAGSTRTVRQAPADRPPSTRGPSETSSNQNSKPRQIETKGEQEHEEQLTNTRGADRPPGRRGPSARHGQSRKTA
jgi:hypothetical protein